MSTTTPATWQVSAGPSSRSYANVFLKHGVALIGPGDAGAWTVDRDDAEFEGSFVRRFASEMSAGDVVLLRTGIAKVAAVGLVVGDYSYTNAFGDVNGWDLQHTRRVRWSRLQAQGYVAALGVPRDVIVTDGIRYRMYDGTRGFEPLAYANLARLKQPAAELFARMQAS